MRPTMIGVGIMIAAVLSTLIAVPLGFGAASGVAFLIGMLIAWMAALSTTATALMRWAASKLKGS